ncbi:hypothetical protein ACFQE8_22560 [Salinirubellus sp. GCM10025818]|uniref:hypothetical protein n=1 Tax=Salinirubellus TaxID=2162630 RepID=UPI0030D2ECC7
MVLNNDPPNTSSGDGSLLMGQRKWAVGVGVVVLVVALVGLWLSSGLGRTGVIPVLAIAVAVLGGVGITLWLIGE